MPWIIRPTFLGLKLSYITQADLEVMKSAQTVQYIFANWYKQVPVPPAPPVPVNAQPPVVTGTPQVGQVLTTDNGYWQHNPISYAYKWYASGVVIAGATAKTYTPVAGDLGKTIQSEVIATNAAGPSAAVKSSATGAVIAALAEEPEAEEPPAEEPEAEEPEAEELPVEEPEAEEPPAEEPPAEEPEPEPSSQKETTT